MNPSPVNCGAVPPNRLISARLVSRNARTRSRIPSGPRRSVSGVELTMSQNSTVTCFISPGMMLTPRLPPLASGRGSGRELDGTLAGALVTSRLPQCPQNLCAGGLSAPQDGQVETSSAPQCPQNFIPAAPSAPHCAHFIVVILAASPLRRLCCKGLLHGFVLDSHASSIAPRCR